jgi:hypothetical protein
MRRRALGARSAHVRVVEIRRLRAPGGGGEFALRKTRWEAFGGFDESYRHSASETGCSRGCGSPGTAPVRTRRGRPLPVPTRMSSAVLAVHPVRPCAGASVPGLPCRRYAAAGAGADLHGRALVALPPRKPRARPSAPGTLDPRCRDALVPCSCVRYHVVYLARPQSEREGDGARLGGRERRPDVHARRRPIDVDAPAGHGRAHHHRLID